MDVIDIDINHQDDKIIVFFSTEPNQELEFLQFFQWIQSEGMDEWTNDFNDPSRKDGHGQESGRLTQEDYFDLDQSLIMEDVQKYITNKSSI